ncbi:MAG: hypothetical protein J6Z43_09385 [Clostridiales bacterium]|nr:hypothetical protein [Clostridiales bacterium]
MTKDNGSGKIRRSTLIVILSITAAALLIGGFFFIRSYRASHRTRTIMLYGIGSNLETAHASLTYSLKQIMDSEITDNVHVIVMTGGADRWFVPEDKIITCDGQPAEMEYETKQIWEIRKDDSGRNKMILLANMDSLDDVYMVDGVCLQTFLSYCKENYDTDLYDLILWDHGYGPLGYGNDIHYSDPDGVYDEKPMPIEEIARAIKGSGIGGKLEIINFDACLMSNVEALTALSPLTDYMVVSAEQVPEFSEYYTDWISAVCREPSVDGFAIGKMIVDDCISFYSSEDSDGRGRPATMAVIDTHKYDSKMLDPVCEFTGLLASDAFADNSEDHFYNKLTAVKRSYNYGWAGIIDLQGFASDLASSENDFKDPAESIRSVLADSSVIYFAHTANTSGSNGISFFFPTTDAKNTKRYVIAMQSLRDYLESSDDPYARVKTSIIDNQIRNAISYGIVQDTGNAVSYCLDNGTENIDYEDIKAVWQICEKPSESLVESTYEHGIQPDESVLRSPWDHGLDTLVELAGNYVNAEEWISSLASLQEREIKADVNCSLPAGGLAGEITVRTTRDVIAPGNNLELRHEPYDGVIGNVYGNREDDKVELDGTWYALKDGSGRTHLASLITTASSPDSGVIHIVINKTIRTEDGYEFVNDEQGAITVSLNGSEVVITGLYKVDGGVYEPLASDSLNGCVLYAGYLTRGYGINRINRNDPLETDAGLDDLGLSVVKMNISDMDDVDSQTADSVRLTYQITNIYGYTKPV